MRVLLQSFPDHYYCRGCNYNSSCDDITSSDYYDNEVGNHYDEACDHDNEAGSHDDDAGYLFDDVCDLDNYTRGTGYSETNDSVYMGECGDERWNTVDTGWVFCLCCEKEKALRR